MRSVVLVFVFVAGAITFAGPESDISNVDSEAADNKKELATSVQEGTKQGTRTAG